MNYKSAKKKKKKILKLTIIYTLGKFHTTVICSKLRGEYDAWNCSKKCEGKTAEKTSNTCGIDR